MWFNEFDKKEIQNIDFEKKIDKNLLIENWFVFENWKIFNKEWVFIIEISKYISDIEITQTKKNWIILIFIYRKDDSKLIIEIDNSGKYIILYDDIKLNKNKFW